VTTATVDEELAAVLAGAFPASIARLVRSPYVYATSYALEELEVELDDGQTFALIFKDVGPRGLSAGAQAAKPEFLRDPCREIAAYRLLEGRDLGTARCYAAVADPEGERYWLFLEKVGGVELFQVGEMELWQQAMRWLARLHDELGPPPENETFLRYDAAFLERWAERARMIAGVEPPRRYGEIAERLASLPRTFLHGELYASNVKVDGDRVCAVDWEMAAVGPAVIDVAALTSGSGWTEEQRRVLVDTYLGALARSPEPEEFDCDLACARLHLALQWLGWAQGWTPPREHVQDWRDELRRAVAELGL
jgi:hypothetical protein